MPTGKYRSRRFARKEVRTPGNENVMHYSKRKPSHAHCMICGNVLSGIPRVRDATRRSLSKSKKRPNRPYAGNLCPGCLKEKVKKVIYSR